MKKNIVLILGLLLTLSACSKKPVSEEVEPSDIGEFTLSEEALEPEYESADYGFRVKGPEGWVKAADKLGMLVTYLKPGDPEVFQENITIAREVKGDLTLAAYVSGTAEQMTSFFEGTEVTDRAETLVAEHEAEKLHYLLEVEGLTLEAEQIIIDRPTEFMVITYMATPVQFSEAYPEFMNLIDSLQLVGGETEA